MTIRNKQIGYFPLLVINLTYWPPMLGIEFSVVMTSKDIFSEIPPNWKASKIISFSLALLPPTAEAIDTARF